MVSFVNLTESQAKAGPAAEKLNFVQEGQEIKSNYCMKFTETQNG